MRITNIGYITKETSYTIVIMLISLLTLLKKIPEYPKTSFNGGKMRRGVGPKVDDCG